MKNKPKGPAPFLSDNELVQIIAKTTKDKENVVEEVMSKYSSVQSFITSTNYNELVTAGLTDRMASSVIASQYLFTRFVDPTWQVNEVVKHSQTAANIFKRFLGGLEHEEFWVLLLNRAHRVIKTVKISQGGLTGTVIDQRLIFKHALESKATSIVVAHNHPSGNKKPSETDISITKKIKKGAELLDIHLLDHIIIANEVYYSFADEGILI